MSNDLHIKAIPLIKLNDARNQVWDSICDQLSFNDNHLSDYYDDLDFAIQEMKDLKEWYHLKNLRYPYCWTRCIAGINIMMLAHDDYSSRSDDVDSADKIESCEELYQWLEREAKEDARMASVLDVAKAEQFLEDEDSVNLSEMTSITEEAAKILATCGGELELSGLTDLSPKAAEALSEGEYKWELIQLNGLTHISTATAEALSKYKEFLSLDGLTELSDAAAEALSKHQGGLSINGLTEISDAAAEALSNSPGVLCLDGLTELSDGAANALSKHQGEYLNLNGLTELTDASAEALSKHEMDLNLVGVTQLSKAAAVAMRTKNGTIWDIKPAEWVASLQIKDED